MERRPTGQYVEADRGAMAFVPDALPTTLPFTPGIVHAFGTAMSALAALRTLNESRLAVAMRSLFVGPSLRREATASSRIEGTRINLREFLEFEASVSPAIETQDTREVANYLRALMYGLNREPDRPITAQFVRELQSMLLSGVRGGEHRLGEYRDIQVFIGHNNDIRSARYVPPPALQVGPLMDDLIHTIRKPPPDIPDLILIAMIHYQFEAVHPFIDGNGRTGRLLVSLLLADWNLEPSSLLSLSEMLESRRRDYVDGLLGVSRDGDWEGWITFFLNVVEQQATKDAARIDALLNLAQEWRDKYKLDRTSTRLRLADIVIEFPVVTLSTVVQMLECSPTTAQKAIDSFVIDGVLREITGRARNRVYIAEPIMEIVSP